MSAGGFSVLHCNTALCKALSKAVLLLVNPGTLKNTSIAPEHSGSIPRAVGVLLNVLSQKEKIFKEDFCFICLHNQYQRDFRHFIFNSFLVQLTLCSCLPPHTNKTLKWTDQLFLPFKHLCVSFLWFQQMPALPPPHLSAPVPAATTKNQILPPNPDLLSLGDCSEAKIDLQWQSKHWAHLCVYLATLCMDRLWPQS